MLLRLNLVKRRSRHMKFHLEMDEKVTDQDLRGTMALRR